jgi:hypothetical protein
MLIRSAPDVVDSEPGSEFCAVLLWVGKSGPLGGPLCWMYELYDGLEDGGAGANSGCCPAIYLGEGNSRWKVSAGEMGGDPWCLGGMAIRGKVAGGEW